MYRMKDTSPSTSLHHWSFFCDFSQLYLGSWAPCLCSPMQQFEVIKTVFTSLLSYCPSKNKCFSEFFAEDKIKFSKMCGSISRNYWIFQKLTCVGKVAQLIRCLPGNHEDPSLIPSDHAKSLAWWLTCNPRTGGVEAEGGFFGHMEQPV